MAHKRKYRLERLGSITLVWHKSTTKGKTVKVIDSIREFTLVWTSRVERLTVKCLPIIKAFLLMGFNEIFWLLQGWAEWENT